MKTCEIDGCTEKHYGLGCCRRHWRDRRRKLGLDSKPHATPRLVACVVCGTEVERYVSKRRMPTCSNRCRRDLTFGVSEPLPEFHMVRWVGKSSPWSPQRTRAARFVSCACTDCGSPFIGDRVAHWSRQDETYCSRRCQRRVERRRRRARESGHETTWRWIEFVAIWMRFDRCCAYCERPIAGQPDPDHVVPLSRGGADAVGNLLPACRSCNSDKGDLTLDEWAADRARRGRPALTYAWDRGDARVRHLVQQAVSGVAWRHRAA